jgi:hypothetical protein
VVPLDPAAIAYLAGNISPMMRKGMAASPTAYPAKSWLNLLAFYIIFSKTETNPTNKSEYYTGKRKPVCLGIQLGFSYKERTTYEIVSRSEYWNCFKIHTLPM